MKDTPHNKDDTYEEEELEYDPGPYKDDVDEMEPVLCYRRQTVQQLPVCTNAVVSLSCRSKFAQI